MTALERLNEVMDAHDAALKAGDRKRADRLREEWHRLSIVAAHEWAKARGLRPRSFNPRRHFGRFGGAPDHMAILDHGEAWGRDRRVAVYVGHPYPGYAGVAGLEAHPHVAHLRGQGFTVRVDPPEKRTSRYFPGSTAVVEIWFPGFDPDFRIGGRS